MIKNLFTCAFILLLGVFSVSANDTLCPVDIGDDVDACEGQIVVLDGTVSEPGTTYQWLFESPIGSGIFVPFVPAETNPTLEVFNTGNYQVQVNTPSTSCSDAALVTFHPNPPDPGPFEMFLCDDEINGSTPDDEISTFDLTTQDAAATGGDPSLMVTWYQTPSDEASDNPIADPTVYQNTSTPQTVVGRVSSPFDCRAVFTLTLTVLPNTTPTTPTPLVVCDTDDDGFADFDLNQKDTEIIGGEPNVNVLYYATLADALAGDPGTELVSPYTNVVPFSQIVYARVTRDVPPAVLPCFTIVELKLQTNPIPDEPDFIEDPIIVSDIDGDGIEVFDLTTNTPLILGTQDPSNFEITYHVTLLDAELDLSPIITPESFVSSGQTIWGRIENLTTACYRIIPFDIVVEGIILAQQPVDVFIDEGDDNGLAIFDLTTQESAMLGTLDPAIHEFTYHITLSDSNNNENAIATPEAYQNIANPQTIYVRLTNTDSGVYVLTNFQIETDGVLSITTFTAESIVVYPNPAQQVVNIQSTVELPEMEILLYDMNGRQLISEKEQQSLNVSQLPSGMYWIEVIANGKSLIKPLVKK